MINKINKNPRRSFLALAIYVSFQILICLATADLAIISRSIIFSAWLFLARIFVFLALIVSPCC